MKLTKVVRNIGIGAGIALVLPFAALADTTTAATTTCSATATTTCAATSTTSTTTSTTLAQIQSLLAQIDALKQQLATLLGSAYSSSTGTGTTTPTIGSGCPVLNRDLSEGDKGDDVKSVQQFLSKVDPNFSASDVTGFFGPVTAAAMMRYQEDNGIASTSTGFVGPLTRTFLGKHCGEVEGEGNLRGISNSSSDSSSTSNDHSGNNHGEDTSNAKSSDNTGLDN